MQVQDLDEKNQGILLLRSKMYLENPEPQVGDYVEFIDGVCRRISHAWWDGDIQSSTGGSFYLGNGYASFSGALYRSVPKNSISNSKELRPASFWFFRDDNAIAHNGIIVSALVRVWKCNLPAPTF